MYDLRTVEGIDAEIRRCRDGSGPSQYLPLLQRCKLVRRHLKSDPTLAAEVDHYAGVLVGFGQMNLADNLRKALPLDELGHLVEPGPQPGM